MRTWGVAFRVTTTVGAEQTYYWSYGPAIDVGVTPRVQYDDRIIDPGTISQDIADPGKPIPTLDDLTFTVAQVKGDLLLARQLDGVRFTRARVETFKVYRGRFSSTDVIEGTTLIRDRIYRGIINENSARFDAGRSMTITAGSPLAEPLQRQSPPFDVEQVLDEDDNPLVPEQYVGKVFPIYGGHVADYGRYREAICIRWKDGEDPRWTATDTRNWKRERAFRLDVSKFREPGDEDHPNGTGDAWAQRSDHVNSDNLSRNIDNRNPSHRTVIGNHYSSINATSGYFKLDHADAEPVEPGDPPPPYSRLVQAIANGIWFNAQEAETDEGTGEVTTASGEQEVYTRDVVLFEGTDNEMTKTVEVKNADYIIREGQQMCWKYHFPTDRLFGCYVGQINMPSPVAEDISDADAFVDPFHIGNICTLILDHLGGLDPDWFYTPDFWREDEGGYADGAIDPSLVSGDGGGTFILVSMDRRRSNAEWLQAALWECGAILTMEHGMLRLRAFNPASVTGDPVLELGPDELVPDSIRPAEEGWGPHFNSITVRDIGHPIDPESFPTITVTKTATGGDHDDPPDGSGHLPFPGEAGETYTALWANVRKNDSGASVTAFNAMAQRMADVGAMDAFRVPFTISLPEGRRGEALDLYPGAHITGWWDPRDEWRTPRSEERLWPRTNPQHFVLTSVRKRLADFSVEVVAVPTTVAE